MAINRPPRIQPNLPTDTVKIPAPKNLPAKPSSTNWLMIALPLGAMLLTVVLMLSFSGGGISYLFFLPIMLATYLASAATSNWQKRKYKKDMAEAKVKYAEELEKTHSTLKAYLSEIKGKMLSVNPSINECIQRIIKTDPRLGERRPGDHDFLSPRIGVGNLPTTIDIQAREGEDLQPELKEELEIADSLFREYQKIKEAPITARFATTGSIGISGKSESGLRIARSIICQLVTHHWPTEVKVTVAPTSNQIADWKWVGKLPHAADFNIRGRQIGNGSANYRFMQALEIEIQDRKQMIEALRESVGSENNTLPLPRIFIVFDHMDIEYDHPALSLLLNEGNDLGIYGIFIMQNTRDIPSECGAVIEVIGNRAEYKEIGEGSLKITCTSFDALGIEKANQLAVNLSNIDWLNKEGQVNPPDLISLLDLFGYSKIEDIPIATWWEDGSPYGYLRAPIGKTTPTSELIFDLNDKDGAHGPHGLIGGMTGSGKSEVLISILLSLALTHHPYDLNFALIDYKGGAAFSELTDLPHTVGVITNIEDHASYAERVILALAGEIETRERILENARTAFDFDGSHIDKYRTLEVKRPLPRLLIVFDEFAEFKQKHPDESKQLISIARKGRSLGVHLILATQNIQSAVDPEILQNSSFRICLKVSEAQDSIQMIGIPDAVGLNRGRAYFRANNRTLFQAAYSGSEYNPKGVAKRIKNELTIIWPDGRREKTKTLANDGAGLIPSSTPTQARIIAKRIKQVALELRLKNPPPVWPEVLSERIYLPDLLKKHVRGGWNGKTWVSSHPRNSVNNIEGILPILGIYDYPSRQTQSIFQLDPNQGSGNLLIFGSPGSGKSVLLKTLITSIALTKSPAEANVYVLDFGGQSSLKGLEIMPHVGAVATRTERERAERLVSFIHQEVARRNKLFQASKVSNWKDYNSTDPKQKLPAIYLIIDNYKGFKNSFDPDFVKSISSLISGGAATGIYLIISTGLPGDATDLFGDINTRLTFSQADVTEYYRIVGRPSEAIIQEQVDISKGAIPGRGLLRGTPPLEFQSALPTYGDDPQEQSTRMTEMAENMMTGWIKEGGKLPNPIEILPAHITLLPHKIKTTASEKSQIWATLGKEYESIAPLGLSLVEDGPNFIIGSTNPRAGKTALLFSWIISLAYNHPPKTLKFIFVDFHTRNLMQFKELPHTVEYIGIKKELEPILTKLSKDINHREKELEKAYIDNPDKFDQDKLIRNWSHILIVVDDYDKFASKTDNLRRQLGDCLSNGEGLGVSIIITGNVSEFPRVYDDPIMQKSQKLGCGVLLGGTEGIDIFNNARPVRGQPPSGLNPGRGNLVNRGTTKLFQSYAYWKEGQSQSSAIAEWINKINLKHSSP